MVKIRQAIVVEGKYDQNTLRQIVDTAIFTTNGFADMKDPALLRLLQQAALLGVNTQTLCWALQDGVNPTGSYK